ncbi:hypothetical protein KM043_006861 [Ampulex compressa]|nr:hypothetical protein KM043_006861 [Ampulex compressa]
MALSRGEEMEGRGMLKRLGNKESDGRFGRVSSPEQRDYLRPSRSTMIDNASCAGESIRLIVEELGQKVCDDVPGGKFDVVEKVQVQVPVVGNLGLASAEIKYRDNRI